jgi:hypothetical protein
MFIFFTRQILKSEHFDQCLNLFPVIIDPRFKKKKIYNIGTHSTVKYRYQNIYFLRKIGLMQEVAELKA